MYLKRKSFSFVKMNVFFHEKNNNLVRPKNNSLNIVYGKTYDEKSYLLLYKTSRVTELPKQVNTCKV